MASGKLGTPADLLAETNTLIYTVPSGKIATANIRVTNRNSQNIKARVAVGSGASPVAADYLTYDSTVEANSILEEIGIVMSPGEKVWVYSNLANVSVRVHGMES